MKRSILPLALLLSGCASPEPDYYALRTVSGAPVAIARVAIEVRRPGLPASLSRPEMMLASGDYRVASDDGAVWAEPLDRQIERTLALDLAQRLPGASVFTESGGLTLEPDYVVDVEWLDFDAGPDGKARAIVQPVISRPRAAATVAESPSTLDAPGSGRGKALAEAVSVLVGRLADRLAADLHAEAALTAESR